MPEEKKPRYAIQVRCKDEIEHNAFHMVAASRGLTFSDMVRKDYLQQEPKVTYATPERKSLIQSVALLSQIVMFLNSINPQDAAQKEQIDSAIQGAILSFNLIQTELHGHKR